MNGVSVPEVIKQAGIEGLPELGLHDAIDDFLPAATTGLTDGDTTILHPGYEGENARLYGEVCYTDGEVSEKILDAALANGRNQTPIYFLQQFLAHNYFDAVSSPFAGYVANSVIRVHPDRVEVDGHPLEIPRPPEVVVELGACLTSRSVIMDQVNFIDFGIKPFAYCPITRLPFTNEVLLRTYNLIEAGATSQMVSKRYYVGREDGVAAATDEIIASQKAANVPVAIADLVMCKGTQHTDAQELEHGIRNAHEIVSEGGMLVVRSLAEPSEFEVGTDEIAEWAFDAGFEERLAFVYSATSHNIGAAMTRGVSVSRKMKTLVVTKSS